MKLTDVNLAPNILACSYQSIVIPYQLLSIYVAGTKKQLKLSALKEQKKKEKKETITAHEVFILVIFLLDISLRIALLYQIVIYFWHIEV